MVARSPSQVRVFDILKPEHPYVEIGTLQIHQSYVALESDSDLVVRLRDEAARLGCDGLLMMGDASRGQGGNVRLGVRGACIVFESAPDGEARRATMAKESKAL